MSIQTATRRDQVLDVAAKLFSTRGYHGTSMQHLADALGILRGSIYAHIDSKEELLFEIVDRGADRFLSRMQAVAASAGNGEEKLLAAMKAHVATVTEQRDSATVFLNDWRFLSPKRRRIIEERRRKYEELVQGIIMEGIGDGSLRPELDPKFASLLVLSAVNWLYQWYDSKGPTAPEDIARIYGEMILDGFSRNGSKKRRSK